MAASGGSTVTDTATPERAPAASVRMVAYPAAMPAARAMPRSSRPGRVSDSSNDGSTERSS